MIADLRPYAGYKDSGVPWLGQIPEDWEVSRVKNLARPGYKTFVDGDWIESPFIRGTGIRLIQTGNIGLGSYREKGFRYIDEKTFQSFACTDFQAGDVLICRLGDPVGRACLAPNLGVRMITSVDVCILKTRGDVNPAFVVYAMSAPQYLHWVGSLVRGSTRDRVSRSMLGGFAIPLPTQAEQAAIVRFLDWANWRLELAIRAKLRVIALLSEQKQTIIHCAVTRGLNPSVPLKPCGVPWLGDIPQDWEPSRSRRLFAVRKELSRPDDVQLSSTQAYGVIPQSEFEKKVGRRVVKISMHLEKRRHVERDDFVISMRSFQGGLERAWASGAIRSSYVVLQPEATVDVGFFAYLFKSHGYIRALQATADFIRDGQDLTYDNFRRVDLPLIPLDEQRAIASSIAKATSGIDASIARLSGELDLLREYRTRLVADVVTGKLDVREVAARLPEEAAPNTVEDVVDLSDEAEPADEEAAV
jgi:type I restriction enzyme S subunit